MSWIDYPTNYSGGTESVTGPYDFFFGYPSYVLGGWYAPAIVLLIFLSLFGIFLLSGVKRSLAASSFITFILSGYLFMRGILNPVVPIALIVLTIVGAIGSKQEGTL